MTARHTPGPWTLVIFRRDGGGLLNRPWVADPDGGTICTLEDDLRTPDGTLMAAAPDLLAALLNARNELQRVHLNDQKGRMDAIKLAEAAIAKARGGR
jgi:hypothetical protein